MTEAVIKILNPWQLEQLDKFGGRIQKLGVNFRLYDVNAKLILRLDAVQSANNCRLLAEFVRYVAEQDTASVSSELPEMPLSNLHKKVFRLTEWKPDTAVDKSVEALATALRYRGKLLGVALVYIPASNGRWKRFCSDNRIDYKLFTTKMKQADNQIDCLTEMLAMLVESFEIATDAEQQIERVGSELSHTYEELVLLYKMSTNMRLTEPDCNYLQMACDSLKELVDIEGIAILLEKNLDQDKRLFVTAGSGLIEIDERMAAILHSRLTEELNEGKEALLDSVVDGPLKYSWPPRIKSIIAVPLLGNGDATFAESKHDSFTKVRGIMVATNRIGKPDFDTIDIKLFNSVANQCAVFIENGRLFKDLKQLFIGSLRALTNSIDAKDRYTRGHSQRVALISRWIAERFAETHPLENGQIQRIYLAGLLHDIGKIGIDEKVLRKSGTLNESERNQIKAHPSIGANILSDIRQMQDIIPGILCHHERVDGTGYPQGLFGSQIPLIGKIIMIADSFDAMTSRRTYREAMNIEQAVAEIEKGLGTQFDEELGRIFIESDIEQMWKIVKNGNIEDSYHHNPSEYGTIAVGALIR